MMTFRYGEPTLRFADGKSERETGRNEPYVHAAPALHDFLFSVNRSCDAN